MLIDIRTLLAVNTWFFALAMASTAEADPLPFNDGRYVTRPELCLLGTEAMLSQYGDQVGLWTRNINGAKLDNGYELYCQVGNVRRKGDDVLFDAYCDAEGEQERIQGKYVYISGDAFSLGRRLFKRCGSTETKLTYEDGIEASTEEIVKLWHEANDECRGGDPRDPRMYGACGAREAYGAILDGRDWCFGKQHEAGYQMRWHLCAPDSNRP